MKLFTEFCLRDVAHGAATSPLNDLKASDAQLNAGNYKKGQIRLHGMRISIENPQGSVRRGVDPGGTKWACTMCAHYGYFKGTTGADGGHVDCFLGPDAENPKCPVFVVNQIKVHGEEFGVFDEHKVMLGYCDRNSAIAGYLINFSPGWKGLGSIEETTIHGLRNWLSHGDTQAPFEQNTIKESRMINIVSLLDEGFQFTSDKSTPAWKKIAMTKFKDTSDSVIDEFDFAGLDEFLEAIINASTAKEKAILKAVPKQELNKFVEKMMSAL